MRGVGRRGYATRGRRRSLLSSSSLLILASTFLDLPLAGGTFRFIPPLDTADTRGRCDPVEGDMPSRGEGGRLKGGSFHGPVTLDRDACRGPGLLHVRMESGAATGSL